MAQHPTINDVAERAGVSKSLVSLVMRGSPNVSEQRRQAVLTAAQELGYRPNRMARSLVQQRTSTLGVMVSDFHNTFFVEVLDGIEQAADEAGYKVIVNSGQRVPTKEVVALETDGRSHLGVAPSPPRRHRRCSSFGSRRPRGQDGT